MGNTESNGFSKPDHSNFKSLEVELFVFECGHGDTILLHLPGDCWCLIDCNLPTKAIRKIFFDFLTSRSIKKLDFIFQTHPDVDHFYGMPHILRHFTSEDRLLGHWCDGGVDWPQIQALVFHEEITKKRYEELHQVLDDLYQADKIQFYELDDGHSPVSPRGFKNKVEIYPVAPNEGVKRFKLREAARQLGDNSTIRLETNDLSLILVLCLKGNEFTLNALFPGDADSECCKKGLITWEAKTEEIKCDSCFGIIKVSHHGSIGSHCPDIVKKGRMQGERLAVVSCGNREGLPDRAVLRSYLDEGWVVLATTKRKKERKSNRPFELANKYRADDGVFFEKHNITIKWSEKDDLQWHPSESKVQEEELENYATNIKD